MGLSWPPWKSGRGGSDDGGSREARDRGHPAGPGDPAARSGDDSPDRATEGAASERGESTPSADGGVTVLDGRAWTIEEALEEITSKPLAVVYKHSPVCWQSSLTIREVSNFARANPNAPVFLVDVIGSRALSQQIAAELGVRHESPQAIIVQDGEAVWETSHFGVDQAAIEGALRGSGEPER